jgi:outer membrane protein assembly factor BamB
MGLAFVLFPAVLAQILLADALPLGGRAAGAAESPPPAVDPGRRPRLAWLVDLGAESFRASPPAAGASGRAVGVTVPGAAYIFRLGPDGSLQRQKRLAVDASDPYGVAFTDSGVALASKDGSVGLWTFPPSGEPSLRWRRELGERASSVGWAGGDTVFVSTWRNRLLGLSAADGRLLWTVDIGGRAEAPAVVEGGDAFVVTRAKALLRIDAATGRVRWKVGLPGLAVHPPVLFGEKPRLALCGTGDGQLLAYDSATGGVHWSLALPAKLAGAPFVGPESVAAVTADGAVLAYSPSGQPRWTQPGSSEGPAALLLQSPGGVAPRLLAVSKMLVGLDLGTGTRLADYPKAAAEELKRRFADAMLEGVKTYSEGEKHALMEQEAFDISGPLFGPAHLFGPHLAFGTEDGWAYVFDATTLRPRARYRAGQGCSGFPLLASARVLAMSGEELFGLDPSTGRVLWRRVLGGDAGLVTGEGTLGVVAGGRVHALNPADGVLQWSLRGRFRSVAPPAAGGDPKATPWLVDDGEGSLRAVWPPGILGSEPLPAGGDLLPVRGASARSWVAATREGSVFEVTWEPTTGGSRPSEGRLVKTWEKNLDERLMEIQVARGRMVVRSESGYLAGLDEYGHESWRLRVSGEDRYEVIPQSAYLVILGAADVRVHDWVSGEMKFQGKVESPALGADIRGKSLLWLDRSGLAHRADLLEGRLLESVDLGEPLASATRAGSGFLVTTTAGELGLVEVGDGATSPSLGGGQAGVKRGEGQ